MGRPGSFQSVGGGFDDFPELPVASSARSWQDDGHTPVVATSSLSARTAEQLASQRPRSCAKLEAAFSKERISRHRGVADMLGEELLSTRRALDEKYGEKIMLEQKIDDARKQLKRSQDGRSSV